MPPAVEIRSLHKHFGQTVALDDLSFQIEQGELFGLLGPNGAGKTTLLSIISCLLSPSAGDVHVLGHSVRTGAKELRRQIGIVPQEIALYGELTARENLAFFGRLYGLSGPALTRRSDAILEAVGLTDRADSRVATFSGGMKRRLNLGAALVHEPRILLLDEPTTGVDPHSRNHIFEEVRRLNAAGITVVYTSHYMEEVQGLCQRLAILDRGRLIACAALADLLQQIDGVIRFRVPDVTATLRQRVEQLPGARLIVRDDRPLELICRDVEGTVLSLLAVLNDLKIELLSLETEPPNLERVFLDLTGQSV